MARTHTVLYSEISLMNYLRAIHKTYDDKLYCTYLRYSGKRENTDQPDGTAHHETMFESNNEKCMR